MDYSRLLLGVILVLLGVFTISIKVTSSEQQPETIGGQCAEPTTEDWLRETYNDELFIKIAECESGFKIDAKNPNSSASGLFQFIDSSWKNYGKQYWGVHWTEKDKLNREDNAELAWHIYSTRGTIDWNESKHCWDK